MAYSYPGVHAKAAGVSSATTSGIDTSVVDFLFVAVAFDPGTDPTLSDNKGNTWTALTTVSTGGAPSLVVFYVQAPSVGTGHTFTASRASGFLGLTVAGFSGSASSPFDQQSSGAGSGTSIGSGTVVPGFDNELIVSALSYSIGTADDQVASGMTVTDVQAFGGGNNYGCALAYLIQTTAASVSTTWSWTGVTGVCAKIASFKAATGGGGGSVSRLLLLGVR